MTTETGTLLATAPHVTACNALLIFPRFANDHSFWALTEPCRLQGAKAPAPPLGLMTVAALLPQSWNFRLINRNTEDVTEADFAWADVVLTGGMLLQHADTMKLIAMSQERDVTVCVGGPDVTARPQAYEAADIVVCGEFESTVEAFVAAWDRGERQGRFTAPKFQADVTTTPVPRYDLIKIEQYLWINLQFSRGCPFTCEFCDIIELYGRMPRTKTTAQILAELDRLYALGYWGHVDFVDDNFIGNKKELMKFLPELRRWQTEHGFPFYFSTEASINLSDDGELMRMMREAGFFMIFVGIESGDEETLISMQKKQNTRRSIAESVHKIYSAGIYVTAGFILGFDTDKNTVADQMTATIAATSIPVCFVNILSALPTTQLARRLRKEGRLIHDLEVPSELGQWATAGINFATLRPQQDILRDYIKVLRTVYDRDAFFARLQHMMSALGKPRLQDEVEKQTPPAKAERKRPRNFAPLMRFVKQLVFHRPGQPGEAERKHTLRDIKTLSRLVKELVVHRPELLKPVWQLLSHCRKENPGRIPDAIRNLLFYLHVSKYIDLVIAEAEDRIRVIEANEHMRPRQEPQRLTASA